MTASPSSMLSPASSCGTGPSNFAASSCSTGFGTYHHDSRSKDHASPIPMLKYASAPSSPAHRPLFKSGASAQSSPKTKFTTMIQSVIGAGRGQKKERKEKKSDGLSLHLSLAIPAWGTEKEFKMRMNNVDRVGPVIQSINSFSSDMRSCDPKHCEVYEEQWQKRDLEILKERICNQHAERLHTHERAALQLKEAREQWRRLKDKDQTTSKEKSLSVKENELLAESREKVYLLDMEIKMFRNMENKVDKSTQTDNLEDLLEDSIPLQCLPGASSRDISTQQPSQRRKSVSIDGLRDKMASLLDGVLSIGKKTPIQDGQRNLGSLSEVPEEIEDPNSRH